MSEPANATSVLGASVRHDRAAAPVAANANATATATTATTANNAGTVNKTTATAAAQPLRSPQPRIANDRPVFVGILLIVLIGAIKILLRRHLSRRHSVSLDLVMVAVGFVLLLMMRLPVGRHPGWIGTALFIGLAAVYRLLGYFEEPGDLD